MGRNRRTQKEVSESIMENYQKGKSFTDVSKRKRVRTQAQIDKMEANKKLRKEDFGQYLSNKVIKKMSADERRKERKRQNLIYLETHPNEFNRAEEFFEYFPDSIACLQALAKCRLNSDGKPICPYCRIDTKVVQYKGIDRYKCKDCHRHFSITVGTPLHNSKLDMRDIFEIIYTEANFRHALTVDKAAELIGMGRNSSYELLYKLRTFGFSQPKEIPAGNIVVIDTMASGGNNINRRDHDKLTAKESRNKQKKSLSFKTKDGLTITEPIPNLEADTVLEIVKKVVPIHTTIHTDEGTEFAGITTLFYYRLATPADGEPKKVTFANILKYAGKNIPIIVNDKKMVKEFNNVPVIAYNYYNHITANHSGGDHGEGDSESVNSIMKKGICYHSNNITNENFRQYLNFFTFHANYAHLTTCQRFFIILKNLMVFIDRPTEIKKPKRRQSTFMKLQREKFLEHKNKSQASE